MAIARARVASRARAGASARAGARARRRRRTTTTTTRRRRRDDATTTTTTTTNALHGMEDASLREHATSAVARAIGGSVVAETSSDDALGALAYAATHPALAAACGLALVWLVPLVVDAAWKFLLFPSLVAVGAIAAMAHPVETLKFLERAAEEISTHPEEVAAALAIATAIALGPYILGAALVALVVSGTTILPSAVKPVLPREFVAATERVDAIIEAANAKEREVESFARDVNAKRTELRAKRLGQVAPPRELDAQTGGSSRSTAVPEFSPATAKSPATAAKSPATSKRRETPRRVPTPSPATQTTTSPRENRLKSSTPLERRRAMNDGSGARSRAP